MAEIQNNEWIITDDDCLQCCRPCEDIGPNVFELTQINNFDGHVDGKPFFQVAHGHIYLDDYSKDEELSVLAMYGYDSPRGQSEDGYPEMTDEEFNQLLAEMYFETEIQEYCCREFETCNEAVDQIQKITGMDFSEYKEKPKSLADQIQSALQKAGESSHRNAVSHSHER